MLDEIGRGEARVAHDLGPFSQPLSRAQASMLSGVSGRTPALRAAEMSRCDRCIVA